MHKLCLTFPNEKIKFILILKEKFMRTLAVSTLLLGSLLSPLVFAQDDNALNYNIVNVQAEASRQVSNDEMHATLYIEKVTNNQLSFQIKLIN